MESSTESRKSLEPRPIAVDLFGGAGGMSLGFEQAGFDVVCAVEFDPAHAAVHRFNFPLCEMLQKDATELTARELRKGIRNGLDRHGRSEDHRRKLDVLFGGPPCQGFSVGGLLDPKDPRNELVEHFFRFVAELQPKAFVMENVPAIATRTLPGRKSTVPAWIRRRMMEAGYQVAEPWSLNAKNFGVPQDRRRLVFVGVNGQRQLPEVPAATHRAPGKESDAHAEDRPVGPSVWDAIGDLPDLDNYVELLDREWATLEPWTRERMQSEASAYVRRLGGMDSDPTDLARPRKRWPSRLTASLRTLHADDVVERFDATEPGDREPVSRFLRLDPDGVASTLRAGSTPDRGSFSAPRPIHPTLPRVISVREAARLHGYPDWFRFSAAKWHGFRQVGNSVCPPLAKVVAESVRGALEQPSVAAAGGCLPVQSEDLLVVPSGAGRSRPPADPGDSDAPDALAA
jgi:DNA (cytosine-5)-methyltransferase 1